MSRIKADRNEEAQEFIGAVEQRAQTSYIQQGECLYCGGAIPEIRGWCDTECRNNWQESQSLRR